MAVLANLRTSLACEQKVNQDDGVRDWQVVGHLRYLVVGLLHYRSVPPWSYPDESEVEARFHEMTEAMVS